MVECVVLIRAGCTNQHAVCTSVDLDDYYLTIHLQVQKGLPLRRSSGGHSVTAPFSPVRTTTPHGRPKSSCETKARGGPAASIPALSLATGSSANVALIRLRAGSSARTRRCLLRPCSMLLLLIPRRWGASRVWLSTIHRARLGRYDDWQARHYHRGNS